MAKIKDIGILRKQNGLSQKKFARRHQVPVRTIQQWEQGKRTPPYYVLYSINEREEKFSAIRNYKVSPKKNFNVCINDPFDNCEKIYPIQQKRIRGIIDQIKKIANVEKAVIFGSSVTNNCSIDSDVDLYLQLKKDKKVNLKGIDYKIDMWTNFTANKDMLNEINKKGVLVYER